jgi:hypothetical protein
MRYGYLQLRIRLGLCRLRYCSTCTAATSIHSDSQVLSGTIPTGHYKALRLSFVVSTANRPQALT